MAEIAGIVGPVLIVTFIGWALTRSDVGLHARTLSNLVLLVATPSLVFHTLVSMEVGLATIGQMAAAALLAIAIAGGLALAGLLVLGGPVRVFLPSLALPNSGNLGIPLALLTFGEAGVRLAVSYFFVVALVQYSIGMAIAAGRFDPSYLARQPLIYSVALVLLVTALDLPVPQFVLATTEILGGMMVPAMLILLGSSLGTLKVTDAKAAIAVATGRLVLGLLAATAVIWVLDLEGVAAGVVFLLATMPTAIVTFVFAERYSPDGARVAGAVVVSTLLTFLCLPVIVRLAQGVAAG